ncbi:MAG: hypothetical protein QUS33_10150 [Dehalococcoidia bacterium]|nr:hypothetical protein [Dehalococcoidia bacterium]
MTKIQKGMRGMMSGRAGWGIHALCRCSGTGVILLVLLCGIVIMACIPAHICRADTPVSVRLTGWGWCLAYRNVGNVTANLTGTMIARTEAPDISDIYLSGSLQFNLDEISDTYDLELRGTKIRSVFFLKQVSGGEAPLIAEFEGTWLDETDYVACEGRLAVPLPNHVAKPYIFVLRTDDREVPSGERGSFVENVEFSIRKMALAFDKVSDQLAVYGDQIKELAGTVLTQVAVIFREIRKVIQVPYFT